jgi:hypothetical protein
MTPKSFENLLIKIPEGVESKKLAGLRIIALIILSWIDSLEFKMQKFKQMYFIHIVTRYIIIHTAKIPQYSL